MCSDISVNTILSKLLTTNSIICCLAVIFNLYLSNIRILLQECRIESDSSRKVSINNSCGGISIVVRTFCVRFIIINK